MLLKKKRKKPKNTDDEKQSIQQTTSDKLSQLNIKEFYDKDGKVDSTKLSNYLKEVADKDQLGIAGIFHLFGNEIDASSDLAGNIAGDNINTGAQSVGTKPDANGNYINSNLTIGDIHYINDIKDIHFLDKGNKIIILGPNITAEKNSDSNRVTIKDKDGKTKELLNTSMDNVVKLKDFSIDFDKELKDLGNKFDQVAKAHVDDNKDIFNGTDRNNRYIDISKAQVDKSTNTIYINLNAKELEVDTPIYIRNISSNDA